MPIPMVYMGMHFQVGLCIDGISSVQQEESELLLGPLRICCGTEAEEHFSLAQTGTHLQAGLSIDEIAPQLKQDALELR